jgi:Toastrack DUF4097
MEDRQREILNQVAAGTISAEEGAARIEALEAESGPAATPPSPQSGPKRVKIVSRFSNTEIVADPSVKYAVADGPHNARQDGDTLFIGQSPLDDDQAFQFTRPLGRLSLRGLAASGMLTVRMNPTLALSATVQAGNLRIRGMHGALACEVQAGSCDVTDFRGPISIHVTAGNLTATGRLDRGASSVRCEMGEVHVSLDRTSNVKVKAHSRLGDISFSGAGTTAGNELTLGSGDASLDCDCIMGSVRIAVE